MTTSRKFQRTKEDFTCERCGFFYPEDDTTPRIFVAAGIGIIPFMSLLRHESTKDTPVPTLLLYSNRSSSDLPFLHELSQHEHECRCSVTHFVTGENDGTVPNAISHRITAEDLATAHTQKPDATFFLCGSIGFVRDMRLLIKETGVSEGDIFTEAFF